MELHDISKILKKKCPRTPFFNFKIWTEIEELRKLIDFDWEKIADFYPSQKYNKVVWKSCWIEKLFQLHFLPPQNDSQKNRFSWQHLISGFRNILNGIETENGLGYALHCIGHLCTWSNKNVRFFWLQKVAKIVWVSDMPIYAGKKPVNHVCFGHSDLDTMNNMKYDKKQWIIIY